jgi:hypothetical protein
VMLVIRPVFLYQRIKAMEGEITAQQEQMAALEGPFGGHGKGCGGQATHAGKSRCAAVPWPGALSSVNSPPYNLVSRLAMTSPNPNPCWS